MASINLGKFKIDIIVQNIDGVFKNIFNISFPKGYWVLLTVYNESGEKETFPHIDRNLRIKTFSSYEEAIDDIALLLKSQLKRSL